MIRSVWVVGLLLCLSAWVFIGFASDADAPGGIARLSEEQGQSAGQPSSRLAELRRIAARTECGPAAPPVLDLSWAEDRSGVRIAVHGAIDGRARIEWVKPAEVAFSDGGNVWDLELSKSAGTRERVVDLPANFAGPVLVRFTAFDADGTPWLMLDRELGEQPAVEPNPEDVRVPVVLELPGGGSLVQYMPRSVAERRGLVPVDPGEGGRR